MNVHSDQEIETRAVEKLVRAHGDGSAPDSRSDCP